MSPNHQEYKINGHNTFYMEDKPKYHTFNYGIKGFMDPPTDYYFRPFFLAIDFKTRNNCYLNEPEVKVSNIFIDLSISE